MSEQHYKSLLTDEFTQYSLHGMAYVGLDDSALKVMSDFAYHRPMLVSPDEPLGAATKKMKSAGEHLLLIAEGLNASNGQGKVKVIGQITACDVLGDEPMRVARETGMHHDEIPVKLVMTPKHDIRVLDWELASRVNVGQILATMKDQDCCHLLVVEDGELRGIFSRSDINKHLEHADMEQLTCAHSLAELIHRVG